MRTTLKRKGLLPYDHKSRNHKRKDKFEYITEFPLLEAVKRQITNWKQYPHFKYRNILSTVFANERK